MISVYKNKTLLPDKGNNQQKCGYNTPPQKDKVCDVSLANMGPCSSEFKYQYPKAQPCVFIKLNKVCIHRDLYENFILLFTLVNCNCIL
jgi:sodium/potassium-transporting ATPase subunit beta